MMPSRKLARFSAIPGLLLALALTACATSTAPPTTTPVPTATPAMMVGDSMMDKGTATPGSGMMDKGGAMTMELPPQQFAAHFVDSMPAHGDQLTEAPGKITLNFNFTLHPDSTISVSRDGQPVAAGPLMLSDNKLSMSAALPANSGDGLYLVAYSACWPDRSCHQGRFGFYVNDAVMEDGKDSMPGDAMPQDGAMMDKGTAMPGDSMPQYGAMMDKGTAMIEGLPEQRFAAHFVDAVPSHGEVFAAAPGKIVLNFDFTLHPMSSISITRDGAAVATPPAALGPRNLSMSTVIPTEAGDGVYTVNYRACWPDASCHDGQLAFVVDSGKIGGYMDLTGRADVTIDMKDIKFSPANIIVSRGTKVTWINREPAAHFVNSDPHPTHNFDPDLNSLELNVNGAYSYTFNQPATSRGSGLTIAAPTTRPTWWGVS